MDVADLKARALAGQAAGPQGREAPLVGDLGQRVRLVHELGQLAAGKEFLDGRDHRFGVDQIVREHGFHVQEVHPFPDAPLHADQSQAELVLQQLADGPDPAVAEVIDIVYLSFARLEMHDVANHLDDVLGRQRPLLKREIEAQLLVQFEPAYRGEIVAFGIEEEVLKQRARRLDGGRFPWAQPLVDLDHGLFLGRGLLTLERVFDHRGGRRAVVEDDLERVDLAGQDLLQDLSRQLVILFKDLLFGGDVHQVDQDGAAHQVLGVDLDLFDPRCLQPADGGLGELRAFAGDGLLAPLLHQVIGDAQAGMDLRVQLPPQLALLDVDLLHGIVHPQEIIGGVPEGFQQDRRRHLPPPVNPDVKDVPCVKLKVEPRAAIRDDPRREQDLAAGVGAALVMCEEGPRRAVQLAHHHPLGPVDDERAALRHQRQFADIDLLLAHV